MPLPQSNDPRAQAIETELASFTGSLERYRHWTRRFIYTPGVHHLAERAGAYWLLDLVAVNDLSAEASSEPFQVWGLRVHEDRRATLKVTDGNERELGTIAIDWTDCPLAEVRLYLIEGVLLLPSEY